MTWFHTPSKKSNICFCQKRSKDVLYCVWHREWIHKLTPIDKRHSCTPRWSNIALRLICSVRLIHRVLSLFHNWVLLDGIHPFDIRTFTPHLDMYCHPSEEQKAVHNHHPPFEPKKAHESKEYGQTEDVPSEETEVTVPPSGLGIVPLQNLQLLMTYFKQSQS